MMKLNTTVFLLFFSLLALMLNLAAVFYFVDIVSLLNFIALDSFWFVGVVIFISILGAVSSFLFSEIIARFMLGVTLIKQPSTYLEKWLFTSVQRQSRQLGIAEPQIGIFYASDMNAFTVGRGQHHAMLAVSSGLLQSLDQDELEAVIGHELAHIENGDMVSLAMARGLVFSLTELPARLFGVAIDSFILRGKSQGGIAYHCVYWFCMLLIGLLPHFIVMWFSRQREFCADIKSASMNGGEKMISALQRLSDNKQHPYFLKQNIALGMTPVVSECLLDNMRSIKTVFSSHPPLSKRIHVIQKHVIDQMVTI